MDIIIEMTDARAPEATRNPEITGLGAGKSRIIILNKADLADENGQVIIRRRAMSVCSWTQGKKTVSTHL